MEYFDVMSSNKFNNDGNTAENTAPQPPPSKPQARIVKILLFYFAYKTKRKIGGWRNIHDVRFMKKKLVFDFSPCFSFFFIGDNSRQMFSNIIELRIYDLDAIVRIDSITVIRSKVH